MNRDRRNTRRGPPQSLVATTVTEREVAWRLYSVRGGQDPVFVKIEDIRKAAKAVEDKIDELHKYLSPSEAYSSSVIEMAKNELRQLGVTFSQAMFGGIRETVRNEVLHKGLQRIDFVVPGFTFNFPIEFAVFDDDDGVPFYLGDRCIVVRVGTFQNTYIPSDASGDILQGLLPELSGPLVVGYAEDDELGSACEEHAQPTRQGIEEVYALEPISPLPDIDHLPPIRGSSQKAKSLSTWLSTRKDVLHFNSHQILVAAVGAEDAKVTLRVRRGALLENADFLRLSAVGFEDETFIFLNACKTAYGALNFQDSLAVQLVDSQAAAVICTIGPVRDELGTMFATEFYKSFADNSVIEAMLAARKVVNDRTGHSLANLYTLVGSPDFALRRFEAA